MYSLSTLPTFHRHLTYVVQLPQGVDQINEVFDVVLLSTPIHPKRANSEPAVFWRLRLRGRQGVSPFLLWPFLH